MKITKGKIIAAAVIAVVLAVSFVWGGGYARPSSAPADGDSGLTASQGRDKDTTGAAVSEPDLQDTDGADADDAEKLDQKDENAAGTGLEERLGGTEGSLSAQDKLALAASLNGGASTKTEDGSKSYSEGQGMTINKETGKDQYSTDPVPAGKPVPAEPQNVTVTDRKMTCTLSVRCDTILDNIDWLDPEKVELVPGDGVIFASQKVTFYEGESVFNLLRREMKSNKIHLEFVNTPIYNSAYIEGIYNLYEFDCGELSGWMYKVNDWFPNYGCSRYQLKEGDVVEWIYTCDLGRDVGGYYATGGE